MDLSSNAIGDRGLESVAAALTHNTALKMVLLHDNCITDDGVEHVVGALEHNTTMTWMRLGGNQIKNPQLIERLVSSLAKNCGPRLIDELRDEIKFQEGQSSDKREIDVAQEAMAAAIKAFDEYLKLAPPDQLQYARRALDLE